MRYAVATGNWNSTSVWSTSSGGPPGASVPTAADDVVLDAASGAITVTLVGTSSCRSLNCTGFTGTLTGAQVILVGDGTAGAGGVAVKLVSGMTISNTTSYTFVSTSGTLQTIDFADKQVSSITWQGAGSNYQLISQAYSNNTVNHTAGTIDMTGQTINFTAFASSGSTTRTLNITNASFTCRSFNFALSGSNLTFISTGSTVIMSAATRVFANEGYTFNNVSLTGTGVYSMTGNVTINGTLTRSGSGVTLRITSGKVITLGSSASFVFSGSSGNLSTLDSSSVGTPGRITKTSGTISCNYLNIKDNAVGGGAKWEPGANSIDLGGNSGWNFPRTAPTRAKGGTQSLQNLQSIQRL